MSTAHGNKNLLKNSTQHFEGVYVSCWMTNLTEEHTQQMASRGKKEEEYMKMGTRRSGKT
jgi:hypothetical protein